MATVPTKDNIGVGRNVVSTGGGFRNPVSQQQAGGGGRIISETGAVNESAGSQQAQIQASLMEEANQLRVDDAINQLNEDALRLQYDKDEGFTNIQGYDALDRQGGVPLSEEYGGRLDESAALIAGSLGNDAQRKLFSERSAKISQQFRGNVFRHEGDQFKAYSKSVRRGTIANRTQEIALNYNNPNVIEDSILSIKAASEDLGRMSGLSAEERISMSREAASEAHMVVIETAIQNEDTGYADEYFKRNAKSMSADHILKVNGVLGQQLDTKLAIGTAMKVMNEAMPDMATSDSDRAFNIAVNTESGGKHFGGAGSVAGANEPTTSTAGAIGIAQVLPTTGKEAAKTAGVEWDEERFRNDPEYNKLLGKTYFETQLKDFDGSLAKAYAAYNAGPGATRKAIKKAGPGGDWLSLLPKETRNYVAKNMKAFGAGSGKNARPTITDVKNKVREEIGTDNPRRLKLALAEAERQYDDVTEGLKQADDKAVSDAMTELIANGGDFTALSPLMRSAIPSTQVGKVLSFAEKLSKNTVETNMVLYNQLTENPEILKKLTSDQFIALQDELDESDFKHFSKERANLLSGDVPEKNDPGSINTSAVKASLDNRFLEMGLSKKENPEQIGGIQKFVNQAIISAQSANGKKMNDAEVEKFINQLFSQRSVYDNWFKDTEGPTLGTTFDTIPGPTKKQITAAFKKQGITPTDQEVLEAYWRQVFLTKPATNDKGSF